MKAWLRPVVEVAAVVLLLPQAFVFMYYFRYAFIGSNWAGLCKALSLYGLSISWVSAPFLVALTLAVRAMIGARVRWWKTLGAGVAMGFLWVAAWNLLVAPSFAYATAALPVLLCSLATAGYAQAYALYLDALHPWTPVRTTLVPEASPPEAPRSEPPPPEAEA